MGLREARTMSATVEDMDATFGDASGYDEGGEEQRCCGQSGHNRRVHIGFSSLVGFSGINESW